MKKNYLGMLMKCIIVFALLWYMPRNNLETVYVIEAGIIKEASSTVVTPASSKDKSVYIYNTHQGEEYVDYNVVEGAKYLQEKLVSMGYGCSVETADFHGYMSEHNISYDQSYAVSKIYVEQTVNNASYDLIIDFHRDAISKEASTITHGGKAYAKLLFVVGQGSSNYQNVNAMSQTLSDLANNKVPGISRGLMTKQSHYNQSITSNMVLVEFGALYNTKEEVQNTVDLLTVVIDDYFY